MMAMIWWEWIGAAGGGEKKMKICTAGQATLNQFGSFEKYVMTDDGCAKNAFAEQDLPRARRD